MSFYEFYEDRIPYGMRNIFRETNTGKIVGIERMKYSPTAEFEEIEYELYNLFEPENVVSLIENNDNTYSIKINKLIQELGENFGYYLRDKVVEKKDIAEQVYKEHLSKVDELMMTVFYFLEARTNLFNGFICSSTIDKINPYTEKEADDLARLINQLILLEGNIRYEYKDLDEAMIDGINIIDDCYRELNSIFNYKRLYQYCKRTAFKYSEYFSESILKKDLEAEHLHFVNLTIQHPMVSNFLIKRTELSDKLDKCIQMEDEVNASPLYRRETFALLALKLEDFVIKENAIDMFVDKIVKEEIAFRETWREAKKEYINSITGNICHTD